MPDDRKEPLPEAALEALFQHARTRQAGMSATLSERLMAEALAAMPAPPPARLLAPDPGHRAGLRARIGALLAALPSGGAGFATLAATGALGVWLGVAVPAPAQELVFSVWQGAAGISPGLAELVDSNSFPALDLAEDGAILAFLDEF